jgi:DNA-binding response OmpR family regulator
MINADNLHVYLVVGKRETRSHLEDQLVLDGFNVSTFASASEAWEAFPQRPARLIITDRRFEDDFSGLDLARNVRQHHMLPYVYIVVLSIMNRLQEIKEGLAAGADDYLLKPHNPFQLRSRILVGMRWLNYIDSLYEGRSAKK